MSDISLNLQQVNQRIDQAARQCGRDPKEITLIAVSKTRPVCDLLQAYTLGQRAFGENYVQEGIEKRQLLAAHQPLTWHFIGPLQSNKSRLVAEHFDWCHTVDRLKIAQRLSEQRPLTLPPLNVLLQININNEPSKSGILPEDLLSLAAAVNPLPNLKLRGLMAIPAATQNDETRRTNCQAMAKLFRQLQEHYPDCDTLSLGMSDDLEAAITAGSTMIRIGTAIFGTRNNSITD